MPLLSVRREHCTLAHGGVGRVPCRSDLLCRDLLTGSSAGVLMQQPLMGLLDLDSHSSLLVRVAGRWRRRRTPPACPAPTLLRYGRYFNSTTRVWSAAYVSRSP